MSDTITIDTIKRACDTISHDPDLVRTPLVRHVQELFPTVDPEIDLYLKLESIQTTGSFKYRGVINQMECLPNDVLRGRTKAIVPSCGNYGKAFAFGLQRRGLRGLVLMPDTVSQDRVDIIKNLGSDVVKTPFQDIKKLLDNKYKIANGYTLFKSTAAPNIAAYGSIAMEILEEVPDPDVIIVNCGSAGLAAGVSATIKLLGHKDCRVFAVSPVGAPTLHESLKRGRAMAIPDVNTKAKGLMPCFISELPFTLCQKYLDGALLVSDEEIIHGFKLLNENGIKVELSGAAGFAALVHGRVENVQGKKVVVVITGGNITTAELEQLTG